MTDEQFQAMFRTVADHLESLATSIQKARELRRQNPARQVADHTRLDRLERILKLRVQRCNRERKETRERFDALMNAQRRRDTAFAKLQAQMAEAQKKSPTE
jgi:hypothetical protein